MSNPTLEENSLTRNKTVTLTIPDFIAMGGFLISLGVSIGIYVKTMETVGSIEDNVGKIENSYKSLDNNSAANAVELTNIKEKITEVKEEIKELKHTTGKR